MLVFLCDSTRVLSRPASNGATLEMKLRLWRLYYLCTYIPLNPNRNNYVSLAWNLCQLTKSLAYATSYNQARVETKTNWELNNTFGGVVSLFTNKVHSKRWSSTSASPSVVAATSTLKNFALASFWSLLTNLSQEHVLPCQVHKLQWFSCRMTSCPLELVAFPSQVVLLDLVQL